MILNGIVVRGKGEARIFGTPTANIYTDVKIDEGIYVGYLDCYKACIYVSTENNKSKVEAYAFNETLDLYDKQIKIEILKFIRPKIIFNSVEELQLQINNDVCECKNFFFQN